MTDDIENEVYTLVAKALRKKFKNIFVSGEYINAPANFPYVHLEENDNYDPPDHMSTSDVNQYSVVMYTAEVYSNLTKGKKQECKKIANYIDELMYKFNFTRISRTPVPNMENASIYRIVARYRAETDGKNIYRR